MKERIILHIQEKKNHHKKPIYKTETHTKTINGSDYPVKLEGNLGDHQLSTSSRMTSNAMINE